MSNSLIKKLNTLYVSQTHSDVFMKTIISIFQNIFRNIMNFIYIYFSIIRKYIRRQLRIFLLNLHVYKKNIITIKKINNSKKVKLSDNFVPILHKKIGIFIINVRGDDDNPCVLYNVSKSTKTSKPIINYLLKGNKTDQIEIMWDPGEEIQLRLKDKSFEGIYTISWM